MIVDEGAEGYGDDQIRAIGSEHGFSHALHAVLGSVVRSGREGEEGGERRIGFEDDIATVAAIPAIGPALGDEFFTSERDATIAAFAGTDENNGTINEHGCSILKIMIRERRFRRSDRAVR